MRHFKAQGWFCTLTSIRRYGGNTAEIAKQILLGTVLAASLEMTILVITKAAFTLYRITFDPIHKYSFPLRLHCTGTASEQCRYKTVPLSQQAQNFSSFLAGTKLYLIAGTKLYRITLSSVNAWLIRNTFVSDQKVIWYSVNTA